MGLNFKINDSNFYMLSSPPSCLFIHLRVKQLLCLNKWSQIFYVWGDKAAPSSSSQHLAFEGLSAQHTHTLLPMIVRHHIRKFGARRVCGKGCARIFYPQSFLICHVVWSAVFIESGGIIENRITAKYSYLNNIGPTYLWPHPYRYLLCTTRVLYLKQQDLI